jgi:glycosyltransferase involved in cell wall biosynthesis
MMQFSTVDKFALPQSGLIVGVDATRNRSGGAIAHIKGLMSGSNPCEHGISIVHFWAHDALLDAVEDAPWLLKHAVPACRGSILHQMLWQRLNLPKQARRLGIGVMFNTDAGSVCPFLPCLTLSQNLLPFEPGEIQRYPWSSRARLRLEILRILQLHKLKKSTVALFLTEYARNVIGGLTALNDSRVIAHGIDEEFLAASVERRLFPAKGQIRCLYVSNAAPYKHQWHVVEALVLLRERTGLDLHLRLVGGGHGPALERLRNSIAANDPRGQFVEQVSFIPNTKVISELTAADLFIFASSCENLPITLLEAMAAGLPIASSDRGPMPEVLGDAGFYFDPEQPETIAMALERLVLDQASRKHRAEAARERAAAYTWAKCASETWCLLASISKRGTR